MALTRDDATAPAAPHDSGDGRRPPQRWLALLAALAASVVAVALVTDGDDPALSPPGAPTAAGSLAGDRRAAVSPGEREAGCAERPGACGYPDDSSTGVPEGVRLRAVGSVTASTPGQVIDGLDVRGEINVIASDVTIRNTRVVAEGGDWVVIIRPGAENLTIEDSEIATPAGTPQDIACVFNIGDTSPVIRRVDIHGCSAGVSSGGGLVEDSYIHDMSQVVGLSHDVGVASNGGGGMTLRHNTIFNQLDQTAAVAFYQDFGLQSDNLVENNLLAGGGYCVYGGDGRFGATSNIRFLNNRFSTRYHAACGSFGLVASFDITAPGNEWSGNYWDESLQAATP